MSSSASINSLAPSPANSLSELYSISTSLVSNVTETPMEEVRRFFLGKSHTEILRYGLVMDIPGAPPLAAHTIVVTMDCEKHKKSPRVLTEYELHMFSREEMVPVLENPGIHGENVLRNVYYYHIRIRENAPHINRRFCRGNPEENYFGSTCFLTKEEAKDFLTDELSWLIDEHDQDGPRCPVIFLSHSVENDLQMLQQELSIDPTFASNVVAIIDTQKIANEQGIRGRGKQIELAALIQHFGVPKYCTELLAPRYISNIAASTYHPPHQPRDRPTPIPIPSSLHLAAPPLLPSPIPISRCHISSLIVPLLLFRPAARHADEDEEEKRNCGCEADHDSFAMDSKVNVFVGIGGSGAFCWRGGGCDERGSECCSCHGGGRLGWIAVVPGVSRYGYRRRIIGYALVDVLK
ncbi:hypothetical protein BKA58DRAFT_416087 [Alternaria rosae]|uniref:uncharacterized protein n=1 Tax=Alternaria rosae TaxID=1187941 RepID=UPI001E8EBA20|nr:uncharacterized protein BKA58DRAFT_416087 [Alternaria rosae]KAH6882030.1 hypothetical protein BKA58DRAFT_416087 [Alternaria rosae]